MSRKMYVFDFDDTLVRSKSQVIVHNQRLGTTKKLSPAEYARYRKAPGDVFDYSEFDRLIGAETIKKNVRHFLKLCINPSVGPGNVAILTARGDTQPVKQFLEMMQEIIKASALHDRVNINDITVVAVGSSDPTKKSDQIAKWIGERGLEAVEFYDNSKKNVRAVDSLRSKLPDVDIKTHLVSEFVRQVLSVLN